MAPLNQLPIQYNITTRLKEHDTPAPAVYTVST